MDASLVMLVKLGVTPALVGVMSVVARTFGPAVGGLVMGLPWMTGPVLFMLALDRGEGYAADMSVGVALGAACIGAWVMGYAAAARRRRWPLSLAAAALAFALAGAAFDATARDIPLGGAVALGYAGLLGAFLMIPRPAPSLPPRFPWWDIPARMVATLVLVGLILVTSERVGPTVSGIVATYPVIATVIGSFTHHHAGADAVIRLFRAMLLSLLSFTTFFLVVGSTVGEVGLVPAFGMAAAAALAMSAVMLWAARRGWIRP